MANYLGLDIGEKRIGVAIADESAPFPTPLITLEASEHLATEFKNLLKKHSVSTVVIGLPRNQSGECTAQTTRVEHIAKLLKIPANVSVYWQDESLTSVKAEAELKKRKKPYAKSAVDSLAATYILEDFITNPSRTSQKVPTAKKNPRKNLKFFNKRKAVLVSGLIISVSMALVLTLGAWYFYALSSKTARDSYSVISVTNGTGVSVIAAELEDKGVIRSALAFKLYVRLHNISSLQAGEYRLSSKQSTKEIASILSSGKVTTVSVFIPPGQRLDQIVTILEEDGFSKEEVSRALAAVRNHSLLKDLPASANLEGYLLPETYQVAPTTSAEQLLRLMLDTFEKRITTEVQAGIKAQGLTTHQAVTLASVIQKEVAEAEAQRVVAQVFLKRYREGRMLGSDVTALYGAITDGVELPKNATQAAALAIAHDSPYNTRKVAGLPPGAISNFNLSALHAVASPTQTDYLFFVAGDDGVTHFARTLSEHESNVKKYCIKGCG